MLGVSQALHALELAGRCCKIQQNSAEFSGIQRNSAGFNGIQRDSTGFNGIQRLIETFHRERCHRPGKLVDRGSGEEGEKAPGPAGDAAI